jgi:hypothetical protein
LNRNPESSGATRSRAAQIDIVAAESEHHNFWRASITSRQSTCAEGYGCGPTNHGRLQSPRALAPNDPSKTADPPIPSGNSVADAKSSARSRTSSTRSDNLAMTSCALAYCTLQRRVEYHRKCPWLVGSRFTTCGDPVKFRRAGLQCHNRPRRRRTISG